MAICITSDIISTDAGSICQTPNGVSFNGSIAAHAFCDARPAIQGNDYGFVVGGRNYFPAAENDDIQRFPFASTAGATNLGNFPSSIIESSGYSSETSGYVVGGSNQVGPSGNILICSIPYSSGLPVTCVGCLGNPANRCPQGLSAPFYGHGYTAGGKAAPVTTCNQIHQYSFSSGGTTCDHADLACGVTSAQSHYTRDHGFVVGGFNQTLSPFIPIGSSQNHMQCFPFASTTNATDIGELNTRLTDAAPVFSPTNAYNVGGYCSTNGSNITLRIKNVIKYPFAAATSSTDIGNITPDGRAGITGNSSQTGGYLSGGNAAGPNPVACTQACCLSKFPFASELPTAEHGSLAAQSFRSGIHNLND
jgi:hypothetical protein